MQPPHGRDPLFLERRRDEVVVTYSRRVHWRRIRAVALAAAAGLMILLYTYRHDLMPELFGSTEHAQPAPGTAAFADLSAYSQRMFAESKERCRGLQASYNGILFPGEWSEFALGADKQWTWWQVDEKPACIYQHSDYHARDQWQIVCGPQERLGQHGGMGAGLADHRPPDNYLRDRPVLRTELETVVLVSKTQGYGQFWGMRSGSGLVLGSGDRLAVAEADTANELSEAVGAVQSAPVALG